MNRGVVWVFIRIRRTRSGREIYKRGAGESRSERRRGVLVLEALKVAEGPESQIIQL